MSQLSPFADAVQKVLEVVMFENWLRFYFITEQPDEPEKLFLTVPEQGMKRMRELYPHLSPLAEELNGREIDFDTSRTAVCTYVLTALEGRTIRRDMASTVFDSATFQTEMQLFNTWVQAHEAQLDKNFLDFGAWRSLFAQWRASDPVKELAAQLNAPSIQKIEDSDTVQ